MTEKPGATANHSLTLRCVGGRRGAAGENAEEARLLIADSLRQIEAERSLSASSCHSIGILSPFRDQVDYISEQLSQALPLEAFDKHEILIGTAHTFQGEERDLMYLSLAVDAEAHAATLRFLEKPDVFNVSITRARVAQYVYTSLDASQLDPDSFLRAYLRHIEQSSRKQIAEPPSDLFRHDEFLNEVEQALAERGFKTWASYPIAGMILDLVAARHGHSCGIDLVGYPGARELAFPLERYKMFHRAGLKIFPLPYSRWRLNQDECLKAIEQALGNLTV